MKSVEASRQWPHDIKIEIEEWQPLAVVVEGSSFTFLAESGDTFTFAQMPKQAPTSLPEVQGRLRRPTGWRSRRRPRSWPAWTTR